MLREIGTEEDFPIYFDMHAEILLRAERFEAAIELLGRAIERAHRTGHVLWLPELYRRRAIVGETRGDAKEACLGDLQDALCHAEAQGAKMLARRARAEIERLSAVPSTCEAPTMVRSSPSLMG
jgi:predicted ATPase